MPSGHLRSVSKAGEGQGGKAGVLPDGAPGGGAKTPDSPVSGEDKRLMFALKCVWVFLCITMAWITLQLIK